MGVTTSRPAESLADERPCSSSKIRSTRPGVRRLLAAPFALIVFLLLNQAAGVLVLDQLVDGDVENQTVGTVKQLLARQGAIDVLFAGSSLVGLPFWELDNFDKLGEPHTSAVSVQNKLALSTGSSPEVFNFAVLGAMLSDQYLLVSRFLVGAHRPRFLLLGVAPRDLVDPRWPGAAHTLCFKKFVGWRELPESDFFIQDTEQWLNFLICRASPLYANRQKIQSKIRQLIERAISAPSLALGVKRKSLKQSLQSTHLFALKSQIRDRERQAPIQFEAAARLLKLCRQRRIKVIVVNMPTTETWQEILSPGFYTEYRERLRFVSHSNNAQWLDLSEGGGFNSTDFLDETGHLNRDGAEKFVKAILPKIQSYLDSRPTN